MKKILTAAVLLIGATAGAQDSGFGAGIIAGEPTGISLKSWIGGDKAIDFGIAWSFAHEGYLHVHSDLLFHKFDLIPVGKGRLPVYYGPGARIGFGNDFRLGFRIVGGIDYLFEDAPLDAFLELAPGLDLIESTDLFFSGGIGIRYWF